MDENFCYECLRIDGLCIEYFPESLKSNKDIVVEAIV